MNANLIGQIAGMLTTLAFLPQVWRVWKTRSVTDISLGMYLIFVCGLVLWIIYGFMQNAWPVILANVATLVLASAVLIMKIIFGRQP